MGRAGEVLTSSKFDHPGKLGAVFLDRDGVLVRSEVRGGRPYAVTSLAEFEVLPEAPAAVGRMKAMGLLAIVVTNQPDLAVGKIRPGDLHAMHAALKRSMPIEDVLVCPHVDADGCACRKPKPGLLIESARRHGLDLAACFMVGDRWRDIAAGRAAGCTTILVDRGYDEEVAVRPDYVVKDVAESADVIARLVVHSPRETK